jgi:hypothetical protein
MPTRRSILGLGLGGAAVLALGGVGLALRPGAGGPAPEGLQALDPDAYRVLEAFAARVCPGSTSGFPSAAEIGLARKVDAHLATMHPADVAELRQALLLLENALAGFLLEGRTTPFTASSPAVQDRALAAWRSHRLGVLRKAYKGLRALCATAYYSDPRVFAAVGYRGPPDFGQRYAPAIQPAQEGSPS